MNLDGMSLIVSFIIGGIGFVLFMYGKGQRRIPHSVGGIALMIFPYFVSNLLAMSLIAVALIGLTWLAARSI